MKATQSDMIVGMNASAAPVSFATLGLRPELTEVVSALGYEEPTPVQREAIPLLLKGRDLLGQAGTGTGKTAAFALPMLQRISEGHPGPRQTCGLVLVPTRELAMQVAEAVHKYAKGVGLSVVPVYGGAAMDQQVRVLKRGAEVVGATPGGARDHIRRGTRRLDPPRHVVLVEHPAIGLCRGSRVDLLGATDVAARGLDDAPLSHVVNYDGPSAPEAYVHRIGRTDRSGLTGVASTLDEPREHRFLRNIEAFTKQRI